MTRTAALFLYFLAASFVPAAAAYALLARATPNGVVFAALPRMFLYHWQHPYQYIAVVACTYAVVATACAPLLWKYAGWRRRISIVGVILSSVLLASIPGGMLWTYHDMRAGFFPKGWFPHRLADGAQLGLGLGWLVIALSAPYNLIGFVAGYGITAYGLTLHRRMVGTLPPGGRGFHVEPAPARPDAPG